jgi:hypothetical protein
MNTNAALPDRRTPTEELPGAGRFGSRRRFENWRVDRMHRTRNAVMGVFARSVLSQFVLNYLGNLPEGSCPVPPHTGLCYRIG